MTEITQAALITISFIAMVISLLLSFIPILPGTLMIWGVAIITAFANGFDRVTVFASILMTGVMLFALTSDFWLPLLGVRTSGLTCLSAVGSFFGGLIGTFIIPIPILGTLIGTVVGALLMELLARQRTDSALRAGSTAFKLFWIGYGIEIASCVVIFVIYLISLATTG